MQNWDTIQPTANYDQHNSWYNNMFATNIKTEPGTSSPTATDASQHTTTPPPTTQSLLSSLQTPIATPTNTSSQLEMYLKQQQQNHHQNGGQQTQTMDSLNSAMTPSPSNNDNLQHFFDCNSMQQQILQQQHYQQQFQQAQQAAAQNQSLAAPHLPLGFNPLTPPGLPTAVLPAMPHFYNINTTNSLNSSSSSSSNSSLRHGHDAQTPSPQPVSTTQLLESNHEKLQAALTPRNTPPMDITPPKSPKTLTTGSLKEPSSGLKQQTQLAHNNNSEDNQFEKDQDLMSNSSEDMKYLGDSDIEDDESIRLPIYNSHGKMKNHRCRSCGLVAITKIAFWEHVRVHMKPEKILQCPKCPFVTELKHHLEYHIRKHKNLKPFQCDKCSYTCVNKSMLNSHRKSHSSVYQYRCADCDYATKYCHSFKLHLRKYDHHPGVVLDEDGLPNPAVVIDVYGTRRGPKSKAGGNGSGGGKQRSERLLNNRHHVMIEKKAQAPTSQLSAALQGFQMAKQSQTQQIHQFPASPAKSTSSAASDLAQMNELNNQQHKQSQQHQAMTNLLPPLASILQQNRNMAFFPYWNLNLQVLAAQQQAAALAQLSPRMRESALQQLQQQQQQQGNVSPMRQDDNDEDDDAELRNGIEDRRVLQSGEIDEIEGGSVDSAMDLSQGTPTPTKEETGSEAPVASAVLTIAGKLDEDLHYTPTMCSQTVSRRKGRVLKLETLLQRKSASTSPEQETANLPVPKNGLSIKSDTEVRAISPLLSKVSRNIDQEDNSIKTEDNNETVEEISEKVKASINDNITSSLVISSGNSSSASTTSTTSSMASSNSNGPTNNNNSSVFSNSTTSGTIYECKYCEIAFKDAVLYTIHMGYHSCDDVFKCNMCGEKCGGPVELFVHMARNAHS